MSGLLLDPRTGRPERPPQVLSPRGVPITLEENYKRGWRGGELGGEPEFDRLPDHIQEMMAKSRGDVGPFAGMRPPTNDRSMYEVLRYWIVADPAALTAAAEAIMVPAFNFGPSELQVGSCLKYTLIGSLSAAVTTPGTFIFRLRWGGVAGALQVTSATLAPTGTQVITTASFTLEYWVTVRSTGAAATAWTQGRFECPGTLETTPASTTIMVTYLKGCQMPATGAAVGASFDSTAALGPTPTYQPSLTTASLTTHLAFLECMN
jgi:hypothetical protein